MGSRTLNSTSAEHPARGSSFEVLGWGVGALGFRVEVLTASMGSLPGMW